MDERRWQRLWQALGLVPPPLVFETLVEQYSDPARAYHNSAHIDFCLHQLDDVSTHLAEPHLVEMAIWFHDAIYEARAADNEARSAAWAVEVLRTAGAEPHQTQRVRELILATSHTQPAHAGDMALLLDIDLAILGQAPPQFDQYEAAIRQEYAWVPLGRYLDGRSQVLQRFLARPRIYTSPHFYRLYEQQARANLARSLANLARQSPYGDKQNQHGT